MILKKFEIILISISLIIVIIYILIYFDILNNLKNLKNIRIIDFENFKKKLKTGDLLFFSENHFNHNAIKFYTNSYFSHVAIIVKGTTEEEIKENKIFLIEADTGGEYKSGTRILPLEKKIKENKIVGLLSIKNFKIDENQILEIFDKYQNLKMDKSMISWIVSGIPFLHQKFKEQNNIFCSELIAKILIDLKILDSDKLPTYYSPQKLIDVLTKNKKYDKLKFYNIKNKNSE